MRWDDLITEGEAHQIRAWLVSIAREGYAAKRK